MTDPVNCSCCGSNDASCIVDCCEVCCECRRQLQEQKVGYLIIKVRYLPKHRLSGDITLDDISSEADYQVKHPGVVETEMMAATENYPLGWAE